MTSTARPRFKSPVPDDVSFDAAEAGARLQRLDMKAQGYEVAGVLAALRPGSDDRPLYPQVTVEMPRRSTKTTTIQNELLGRCATIPGYQVVSTAQDGTRASQFFRDMMDLIENHANEIIEQRTDERQEAWEELDDPEAKEPEEFTYKDALAELGIRSLYYSQQREYIKWRNGSKWRVAKPEPSGLRGGAADVIWFDEGGELDPETSPALLAGALPMMDTKPRGQIIISGTPGPQRAGMFWEALEKARANPERFGVVDYSGDDFVDPHNEENWWLIHPGLACGLTSIETIRERYNSMAIDKFMMEYLCVWPPDAKVTALNLKNFDLTTFDPWLGPPENHQWGIGYDVEPDGSEYAVAVAWYDDAGDPWVQVMRHRIGGSAALPEYLARGLRKHKRVLVGYDSIGQNIAVAQTLQRANRINQRRIKALTMKDVGAATSVISQANDRLAWRHAEHPALKDAVKNAAWRQSGDTRLFARKGGGISPVMACVHALATVSTMPARRPLELPSAEVGT